MTRLTLTAIHSARDAETGSEQVRLLHSRTLAQRKLSLDQAELLSRRTYVSWIKAS
jgi:hypothetical protein